MGAATIIETGTDITSKQRLAELQKSVGDKSKAIPQMKKALEETTKRIKAGVRLTPEQLKNARALQITLTESQTKIQEELKEIEKLDKLLKNEGLSQIVIRGTMYQGVVVSISGATMTVKKEYTYCRLIKKDGDIASAIL